MSDDFIRDLEEELVAAARLRATRRSRRLALPRVRHPALRDALLGAATLALLVAAVLVVLGRAADEERAADERAPAPPGAALRLLPMQPLASCAEPAAQPAGRRIEGIALLSRPQRQPDALPFSPSRLPIGTFDRSAPRRPAQGRMWSTVYVVPSSNVAADGRCGSDDGPGLCLVADERQFRCFPAADVDAGRALAQTAQGTMIGIVPDGIDRVTVFGGGPSVGAKVWENVYEVHQDDRPGAQVPGTQVKLRFERPGDDGCRPSVAPELLTRVAVLRDEPQPGLPLPRAARDVLRDWEWQFDAIIESGARYWGGGDDVGFWAVPVAPLSQEACAPATRVCIVAVPARARADAQCVLRSPRDGIAWKLAPLLPGRAVIFGVVPDRVIGARVTIDGQTAEVEAGDNVIGGVLPFSYGDGAPRVELMQAPPKPVVGVVDATGGTDAAADVRRRVVEAGYQTPGEITPGVTPQPRTEVDWWPGRTTRADAERVAQLVGADDVHRIADPARTPRPVLDTDAAIVVVVGSRMR